MKKQTKDQVLYIQLKKQIRAFREDERFPSVRELSKAYGVSSLVVKKAMHTLVEEGFLHSIVGSGTFVTQKAAKAGLRILMLSPNWHAYSPDIELFLRQEAASRGDTYKTVIYDYAEEMYFNLPYQEADAIIIRPHGGPFNKNHIKALQQAPIPVIFVKATYTEEGLSSIGGNNLASGRLAANYLIDKGHRSLAFIQSTLADTTLEAWHKGFREVCKSRKVPCEDIMDNFVYGDDISEKMMKKLSAMYRTSKPSYTAAFTSGDVSALGVLKGFYNCGIKVPQEMSLLGVGGDGMVELFTPSLSVVEISREQMARAAYEIIDTALQNGKLNGYRREIAPVITERESVCAFYNSAKESSIRSHA